MKITWKENGRTIRTRELVNEPAPKYNRSKKLSFREIMDKAGSDAAGAVHHTTVHRR